ncbi:hypothetical protein [Anaeroselena agilis]|uniref:Uncharacterized protein n=1 Tax=Anaeroselena agilis TaxID=3063788 RepID=A0ABU3NZG2_9FIRM|nr:hypothetical protein [Selenomonadales bacterium 4137-cl]
MIWTEDERADHLLANREYMERALREAVMVTRNAIREISMARDGYLFEEYVRFLDSLTGDLTRLTGLLLAIETEKKPLIRYRGRHDYAREVPPPAAKRANP